MKKILLAITAILLITSCVSLRENGKEIKKMIALLERRNISYNELENLLQEDNRCAVKFINSKKMTCNKLQMMYAQNTNEENRACYDCSTLTFCGMSQSDLVQNVQNYRDNVWSKTSNFGGIKPSFSAAEYKLLTESINDPTKPPHVWSTDAEVDLDAQFMDIDIAEMQNYLCAINNIEETKDVNTLRLYYIRYDNNTNPTRNANGRFGSNAGDWTNKHSICIVPVQRDANLVTVDRGEITDNVLKTRGGSTLIWDISNSNCNTTVAINHNQICPPFKNCAFINTILSTLP